MDTALTTHKMHVLIGLLLVAASSCSPAVDLDELLEHLYGNDNYTQPVPTASPAELTFPVDSSQPANNADKVAFPDETAATDVVSFPTDNEERTKRRAEIASDAMSDSRKKCTINGIEGECIIYYKCSYEFKQSAQVLNPYETDSSNAYLQCPSYVEICCPHQLVS